MDKTFRMTLAALILYGLVTTNQLFTIGGFILALIVCAIVGQKPKPKLPPRIYPEGQEPDAEQWTNEIS